MMKKFLFLGLFLLTACTSTGTVSESTVITDFLSSGKEIVHIQGDPYSVAYDPSKWTPGASHYSYFFESIEQDDVEVLISFEETQTDYGSLKADELVPPKADARQPDNKLLLEERRTVNGVEVLFMKTEHPVTDISGLYDYGSLYSYGYYYTGPIGTISFVAIALNESQIMEVTEAEIIELLNGLIIEE